jgi:hypothetical protein
MLTSSLLGVLTRDIKAAIRELNAYPDDASVWKTHPAIPNTSGTLALHLAGNLRHFIGAVLGKDGYVRDRDAEFARRDVPRGELVAGLEAALVCVAAVLPRLGEADLGAVYPLAIAKLRIETGDFLLHLATHFTYHLGQMDYHRRAVAGSAAGVNAVLPTELSTARPE